MIKFGIYLKDIKVKNKFFGQKFWSSIVYIKKVLNIFQSLLLVHFYLEIFIESPPDLLQHKTKIK